MKNLYEIDVTGLRKFGLLAGSIIAVLFGFLFPWIFERTYPLWPWILGGSLTLWGILLPSTLRPVYVGWMKFGHVLGVFNTTIILSLVFFVMFFPIGIIMRLIGKDPMHRRFDGNIQSYKTLSRNPSSNHMEKPY